MCPSSKAQTTYQLVVFANWPVVIGLEGQILFEFWREMGVPYDWFLWGAVARKYPSTCAWCVKSTDHYGLRVKVQILDVENLGSDPLGAT